MSSIGGLVHSINDCINRRNSARLRLLLQVNNSTTQEAVFAARNANPRWDPVAAANRLPEGWAEFLALFWACIVALQEGKRGEAYDKLVAALQPFIKVFREDSEDWVVPLMHSMVHNLRSVAQAADQELEAAGKPATRLGDCGDQLRKCFAVALQAPGNQGKRLAALDVVNVSIKTYFKLNTLRLCKNLTRTVVSRQFAPFELFPVSQRVTYKFYVGRLAVFDENFQEARESLEYALQHCHRGAVRNKAKILKYLVPVRLRCAAPVTCAAGLEDEHEGPPCPCSPCMCLALHALVLGMGFQPGAALQSNLRAASYFAHVFGDPRSCCVPWAPPFRFVGTATAVLCSLFSTPLCRCSCCWAGSLPQPWSSSTSCSSTSRSCRPCGQGTCACLTRPWMCNSSPSSRRARICCWKSCAWPSCDVCSSRCMLCML
ncbi:hypothetical protein ACKKBG_A30295 [Auxenochlorella protothecoides x Auxenochlorella symbiontica]